MKNFNSVASLKSICYKRSASFLLFFLILLIILFLLSIHCNHSTEVEEVKPGRRDYTWTVDTLFLPFNFFTDISGTSSTDVWVCGPGGDADKTLYHYDGIEWKTDLIPRPLSPVSISTKTYNEVWCGGQSGMIWNYSNGQWKQNYKFNLNGNDYLTFQSIRVISSDKILAGGYHYNYLSSEYWGIIFSYDKGTWKSLNIPLIRTTFAGINLSDNGKIYLWGITNEQFTESRYQFFELDGNNFREIYSGSQNTDAEYGSLLQLGNKIYFIIGYDFFSYNGSFFSRIGRLSSDPKFLNVGWGRSEKDIFIGMRDGVAHFNGENTIYLFSSTENIYVRQGIVFASEIFFIGSDSYGNNLMIHGKLR